MEACKIKPGDAIGIVAPCYSVQEHQYDEAIRGLESLGYRVVLGKNLYKRTYGYSATEFERAEDFNAMIEDREIKMVLFGGGYVGNEIIPYIRYKRIRENPKLFVSYSDGTTILNAICAQTGLVTYYGQKPSTFGAITGYNKKSFEWNFVSQQTDAFMNAGEWDVVRPGYGEGILIGGYLENFALLLGSAYFKYGRNKKYILFLEDYEDFSQPIQISMYLSHIEQSPFLRNVAGVLFGHYSDTRNEDVRNRLSRFGERANIPVLSCDDFGHGVNNGVLQIGRKAILDSSARALRYVR